MTGHALARHLQLFTVSDQIDPPFPALMRLMVIASVSSVLVDPLWLPIHISLRSKGLLLVVFPALWFVSLSIVVYALVQDTDFSVLVATLFHLSINLINLLTLFATVLP